MPVKQNRFRLTQPESTPSRVAIGTVIGLCLAARPGSAAQTAKLERFTARPRAGAVILTWAVPPVTDVARVVIRFHVDGPAPTSPALGLPLYDEPTPPGTVYGTRHARLSPRHAYAYAAFGLDAAGNVISSSTASGTPLALEPPATVQNLRRADVAPSNGPPTSARGQR